jgi:hypothetical protein
MVLQALRPLSATAQAPSTAKVIAIVAWLRGLLSLAIGLLLSEKL